MRRSHKTTKSRNYLFPKECGVKVSNIKSPIITSEGPVYFNPTPINVTNISKRKNLLGANILKIFVIIKCEISSRTQGKIV